MAEDCVYVEQKGAASALDLMTARIKLSLGQFILYVDVRALLVLAASLELDAVTAALLELDVVTASLVELELEVTGKMQEHALDTRDALAV